MHRGWIAAMVIAVAATMLADDADARRLGGGRSFGAQRQSVAPPAAAPHAPATAATPGAATNPVMPPSATAPRAAAPAAAAAAPVRSGMSRWLGPIAGLAAGLGLAALMSHLGLSEAFGSFLLLAVLAIAVVFVLRALFGRRAAPAQYANANAGTGPAFGRDATPPRDLDWGRTERVEPVLAPRADTAVRRIPPGFDTQGFLRNARTQFTSLQAAWDAGDKSALGDVTTPQMFAEIERDLATRGAHQRTEIVRLDADLLEVVSEGREHWASVRFSGLLREDGGDAPRLFDETWNLVKPVDGSSGWLLAGIQQNEVAPAV